MKWKGIDFSFVFRYLVTVLMGYLAVSIFIMSFIAATEANGRLRLTTPLSETTALILATMITLPLVLPFVWKRLSKLKIGDLEINLSDVSAKVKLILPPELEDTQRFMLDELAELPKRSEDSIFNIVNPLEYLASAISRAQQGNIIELELGVGKTRWWSTRLYLVVALIEDYTNNKQMIFLASEQFRDRIYVGGASLEAIRRALAVNDPRLSAAYEAATREPTLGEYAGGLTERLSSIAFNFISQFSKYGGEEQVKQFVTKEFLEQCRILTGKSLEWSGAECVNDLRHEISEFSHSWQ